MKPIKVKIIINSFRSRRDHSLGFSAETPELTTIQKAQFMDLQGMQIDAVLVPENAKEVDMVEIKTEVRTKTQAQRIRGVLYRLWETYGKDDSFEAYYLKQTERIIESLKSKLN